MLGKVATIDYNHILQRGQPPQTSDKEIEVGIFAAQLWIQTIEE